MIKKVLNTTLFILLIKLGLAQSSYKQIPPVPECSFGTPTGTMENDLCMSEEFMFLDSILNARYNQILREHDELQQEADSSHIIFIIQAKKLLIKSQKSWVNFKENEIKRAEHYDGAGGGTSRNECIMSLMIELTRNRIYSLASFVY